MPIWQPDTGGCWCCHYSAADQRAPLDWGIHLGAQVDQLRARGSRVETIFPDSNSRSASDANLRDPSTRPPAARAGYTKAGPLPRSSPNSGELAALTKVITLGRTVTMRAADVLAYFDRPGTSNGQTEASTADSNTFTARPSAFVPSPATWPGPCSKPVA